MATATGVVLAEYRGLKAGEIAKLRNELRAVAVDLRVIKNTLFRRAVLSAGEGETIRPELEAFCSQLSQPLAAAFGHREATDLASAMRKAAAQYEALQIRGGILAGTYYGAEQIQEIAQLPSKPEMIAKAAGSLQAPLYGLFSHLTSFVRELVLTLKALEEQKGASG